MFKRLRYVEQWVPHDGTVWRIWYHKALFQKSLYWVDRDWSREASFVNLEDARNYIRKDMAVNDVQVPYHLLPTDLQWLVDWGISPMRRSSEVRDLVMYGWYRASSDGLFRKVSAK